MVKSERLSDRSELKQLADYLSGEQDAILYRWKERVTADRKQPSTLAQLSQDKFYDDIPSFLNQLCHGLCDGAGAVERFARKHGAHRWEHGLDLRELIYEWKVLHEVLLESFEQYHIHHAPSAEDMTEAFRRLSEHVHDGISLSVDEYYRLLQLKAESKVHDLEQVIEEHGKVSALRGQNLQRASHDMKGSMTAIRMNLSLLERADLDENAGRLLENLNSATDGLNQLLKNLLDLSRLEAGHEELEVETFDVAEEMRELCRSMGPLAEAEQLEMKCSGQDSLTVEGDRLKVRRIAQNLLLNALKYTPEGYVKLGWEKMPEDNWKLVIRDSGPGIDESNAAPFLLSRVRNQKENRPATTGVDDEFEEVQVPSEGIGLLIVRQLCQLLDAVVEVDSEQGEGTGFMIVFPGRYDEKTDNG